MLAKVFTCTVVGLDGELVQAEVDIASGLPPFASSGAWLGAREWPFSPRGTR
jgi:hypothetical protein